MVLRGRNEYPAFGLRLVGGLVRDTKGEKEDLWGKDRKYYNKEPYVLASSR